jgi:hypothetical protein
VARGQSFEASDGNHDDLMMNLVMFGYFATGNYFTQLTDVDIKDMLYKQRVQEIENDVLPFGFIDDGVDAVEQQDEIDSWSTKRWAEEWGGIY